MTTQCENLANHLRTGATITALEALSLYGISRTAARIRDLRRQGMVIDSPMIDVDGAHGHARVAQYKLAVPRVEVS